MWKIQKEVEVGNMPAAAKRLNELALCLVLPRPEGFPQYMGDVDTPAGWDILLKLTERERYPWQL